MDNNPDNQQPDSVPPAPPEQQFQAPSSETPNPVQPQTPMYNPAPVPEQPQSAPTFASVPPTFAQADATPAQPFGEKRSRKKLIIGILVGVLLVLIGASVAAYTMWYQNPQKVVTDAIVNGLKAETMTFDGSFLVKSKIDNAGFEEIMVTMDGKSTSVDGTMNVNISIKEGPVTREFSGSGLIDQDANLYFKVNKVNEFVEQYLGAFGEVPPDVQAIIDKIDGNWIRISAEDLGEVSEEYKNQQQCFKDAAKKIEADEAMTQEVAELYNANQFILITEELGTRDGNLGYVLDADDAKLKAFATGVKETGIYKELKNCDEDFEFDPAEVSVEDTDDTEARFEVWISQFGHELAEAKVALADNTADGALSVRPVFNEPVTVEVPTEYVPFSELLEDFENLTQSTAPTVQRLGLYDEVNPREKMPSDGIIEWDDPII